MRIRDVELAVEHRGQGPLVLWGHGLTSSRANEDARPLFTFADAIPAAGFELVRYDARGHGQSDGTALAEDYRWPSLADDALALHDALGGAPAVFAGASMGAATMLHLAVRRPDVVRALVLVIPPTAWATRVAQRELYEGSAAFVRKNGKAAYVAATQRLPPLPIFAEHPEVFAAEPDITEALLPTILEGAATSDLPPVDALRGLAMPALILAWDTDPGHPVSTAEILRDTLPASTLHVARTIDEIRGWGDVAAAFLRSLPG